MNREFVLGLVERALAAALFTFLTVVTVTGFDFTDVASLKGAVLLALPAGLSVVKSALSSLVGDPESGSFVE